MSSNYRSNYRRRNYPRQDALGRIARPNRRPGPCHYCAEEVPAGAGQLWRGQDGAWSAVHSPAEWHGSPTSGQYAGGCPGETDALNRNGNFGGPGGPRSERDRIASLAATHAASKREASARTLTGPYSYTTTGERRGGRYGRCEDAPCCGCCD